MTSISEIFQTFGPDYVERFAESMPPEHRKAINAINLYVASSLDSIRERLAQSIELKDLNL